MNKYFVQYRMYDASSKRFITQDTNEYINIYDPVSINKYVYANNNPTNYVDYNGHEATTPENEFSDSLETRMYMEDGSVISDKTLDQRAEFAFAMNSIYLNLEMIGLLAMMVPGAGSLIMASIFMPIILWNSLDNLSYMMQANQMRIDYAAGNYESDGGKHALRESFGDTAYEVITMVVMTVEITAVVQQTAKAVSGALANKLLRSGSVADDAVSASLLSKMDDVKVKKPTNKKDITQGSVKGADNRVSELFDRMPEFTGTNREKLLSATKDKELRKIINELYRETAEVGDGGTADMLIKEFYNGSSKHYKKSVQRLGQLKNLQKSGKLGLNDSDIAESLIEDLEKAIGLFD